MNRKITITIFTILILFLISCAEIGMGSSDPVRPDRMVLLQKYGAAMREVMPVAGTATRTTRSWAVSGTDYDSAFEAYRYGYEGTVINRLLGYGGPSSLQMNLDAFDQIVDRINTNISYSGGQYSFLYPTNQWALSISASIDLSPLSLGTVTGNFIIVDLTAITETGYYGAPGVQVEVLLSNQMIAFEHKVNGDQLLLYYAEVTMLSNGIPTPRPSSMLLYGNKTTDYIDFRIVQWERDDTEQMDWVQSSHAVSSNDGTYQVRARMECQVHPASSNTGETNIYLLQGDQTLFSVRMQKIDMEGMNTITNDECFNVNPNNFAKLFPDGDDGSVTNTTIWSGSNALTNITMPLVHDPSVSALPHMPQLTNVASLRWW